MYGDSKEGFTEGIRSMIYKNYIECPIVPQVISF